MQPVPMHGFDPQFGQAVSEWQPGGKKLIGLIVLFGLFCVIGLVGLLALLAEGELVWAAVVGLVLFGWVLLLMVVLGLKVTVYTHGIERAGRFRTRRLAWDQLESYTLTIIDPAVAAHGGGGLLGALVIRALTSNDIKPQSVTLKGKDRTKIVLPNHLKNYDTLLGSLLPYLTDRLAAEVHQSLRRGVPVAFGKRLTLDPAQGVIYTGFFGGKKALPFAEVAGTELKRAVLVLGKYGQNKAWAKVAAASVPNLNVFQKIVAQASTPRQVPPAAENFTWVR